MKNESTAKILGVALGVCLVCAVLVSTTAVTLKPVQEQNRENDRLQNILDAAGLSVNTQEDLQTVFDRFIKPEVITLKTGLPVPADQLPDEYKPDRFNIKAIASDAEYTLPLSTAEDKAQIKRVPKFMVVYRVMDGDSVVKRIFPVYGKGLWSTMYGFLALGNDLRTIDAFTFYEHGETPGLGGEVDNPRWKRIWIGKQAYDAEGNLAIEVIKGKVDPDSPRAKYQIDGLSGSTLTTRGVNNLVRFWMGEHGWGPYLDNLRSQARTGVSSEPDNSSSGNN